MTNFLLSKANREFFIFLFFLALAGAFWFMMRLNETYENEVRIIVRYANVRKAAVLTSGETDTLRVTISDKGFNILGYVYGQASRPVDIDFAAYAHADGTGTVGSSDIKKMLTNELPASAKIISIKPEKLVFYYNNGESKRVPVLFKGVATPHQLYFLSGKHIDPDSVTIYASRQRLDSIKAVYTEEHSYSNLRDTLVVTTMLTHIQGVKAVPDRVTMTFVTDVLTEVRIDNIPIKGINMPADKVLRTFPAKTGVRFVTGMKKYQSLSAGDFQAVADYNEFSRSLSQKCNVYLATMPEGISNAHLDVTQADYLIENKQQ